MSDANCFSFNFWSFWELFWPIFWKKNFKYGLIYGFYIFLWSLRWDFEAFLQLHNNPVSEKVLEIRGIKQTLMKDMRILLARLLFKKLQNVKKVEFEETQITIKVIKYQVDIINPFLLVKPCRKSDQLIAQFRWKWLSEAKLRVENLNLRFFDTKLRFAQPF